MYLQNLLSIKTFGQWKAGIAFCHNRLPQSTERRFPINGQNPPCVRQRIEPPTESLPFFASERYLQPCWQVLIRIGEGLNPLEGSSSQVPESYALTQAHLNTSRKEF